MSTDLATKRLHKARACLNFKLRRTTRLVNRYYDQALRPVGLKVTQFNLLIPLALNRGMPLTRFAAILGMDRSALARNLKPLKDQGLVRIRSGEDRRTRIAILTQRGEKKIDQAFPLWEKAQTQLLKTLRGQHLHGLNEGLQAVVRAIETGD